jgi:HSP20 family molecular chaperone IbpA
MFVTLSVALIAATGAAKDGSSNGRETAAPDAWAEQDQWIEQARKDLLQGSPIPFKDFDRLFNDQFFSHHRDPFAEMLEFQKRLDSELGGPEKTLFGRSWNDWSGERMGLSAIQEKTRETDKEVIVELKIAGLDKDSLNINVSGARIRVSYDAKKLEDKKDGKGREIFKSESIQHFEKIMPIPQNADPKTSRIAKEGDVVKIIFPRKEGAVKADF